MAGVFDVLFGPPQEDKPKPAQAPGLLRPSFMKKSALNIDQWFDAAELWNHVAAQVKNAPVGAKIELPIAQVTHPGIDEATAAYETAHFFGKDREIAGFDAKSAWNRILTPFLDDVEEALNSRKPKELRGKLRFDVAPDSSLTLYYLA